MVFLLSAFVFSYLVFVVWVWLFWERNKSVSYEIESFPKLSILCVGRNEAANIDSLLLCLKKLDYPGEWEFLFVDDHSEDSTIHSFENLKSSNQFLIPVPKTIRGKKMCLEFGVGQAKGDWVLCTDADCVFEPEWARTMVSFAISNQKMWIGGVVAQKNESQNTFLANWQKIETLYLNLIGGVMLRLGLPILANGANLLFEKRTFRPFEPESMKNPSGDDVLMAQNRVSEFGRKSIGFCFHPKTKVVTQSPTKPAAFFKQKLRWASKFNIYRRWDAKAFILFFSCVQLSWLIMLFFDKRSWWIATVLKAFLEILVFSRMARHYGVKQNLIFSLITNGVYPYYSLTIGVLARFKAWDWKNRSYKL